MIKNKIIKAILKINPTAQVSVSEEDINTITWENGTTPISKSEIEAMIPTVEQEIIDQEANKIAKKASAKSKLAALGLDEDEINSILGA
tara:strand:- start:2571 stop:2837 length:267 start_codon:yes stop_codon:yes gene_type:complete